MSSSFEKIKKVGGWIKKKYVIGVFWSFLVGFCLGLVTLGASAFAFIKFNEAGKTMNKASEVMLTKTGIFIDSVNVDDFQKAERIISRRQIGLVLPMPMRNAFLYDAALGEEKPAATTTAQ